MSLFTAAAPQHFYKKILGMAQGCKAESGMHCSKK